MLIDNGIGLPLPLAPGFCGCFFYPSSMYLLQTDPRPFTLFPFAHHFLEPGEFVSVWLLSFSLPFKPRKLVFLSSLALALSRTGKEAPAHLLRGEQETVAFLEV